MTEHINLREALEIMDAEDDPMVSMQDERLNQFISDIESAGQEILSPLDPEYLMGAISFLQASAVSGLMSISHGDMNSILFAMSMLGNDDFSKLVTIVFKFSVGLSAIEELR